MRDDAPLDPFAGDPTDPATLLPAEEPDEPLTDDEREDILEDLEDLTVFAALLEPRGVKGIVLECDDCHELHYYAWELMRSNLRNVLDGGQSPVHEPAFGPDPSDYVTWDYARGFADAVLSMDEPDEGDA